MTTSATYHSPMAEKIGYRNAYGNLFPGTLLLNHGNLVLEVQKPNTPLLRWLTGNAYKKSKLIFSFHISNIASIERGIYQTKDVLELTDRQGKHYCILVRNYREWEQVLLARP